jgi:predicted Rossmann fold nucleotide-binding protein DprA/Smf involved in DNA uptake
MRSYLRAAKWLLQGKTALSGKQDMIQELESMRVFEKEAARKIDPHANTLRETAYATISHSSAGLTADEVATRMGETVLAIRPRLTELKLAGRIVRTGQRRKNVSGMNAAVWCCT